MKGVCIGVNTQPLLDSVDSRLLDFRIPPVFFGVERDFSNIRPEICTKCKELNNDRV